MQVIFNALYVMAYIGFWISLIVFVGLKLDSRSPEGKK